MRCTVDGICRKGGASLAVLALIALISSELRIIIVLVIVALAIRILFVQFAHGRGIGAEICNGISAQAF